MVVKFWHYIDGCIKPIVMKNDNHCFELIQLYWSNHEEKNLYNKITLKLVSKPVNHNFRAPSYWCLNRLQWFLVIKDEYFFKVLYLLINRILNNRLLHLHRMCSNLRIFSDNLIPKIVFRETLLKFWLILRSLAIFIYFNNFFIFLYTLNNFGIWLTARVAWTSFGNLKVISIKKRA